MPSGITAGCHDIMIALGVKSRIVGSSLGKTGAEKIQVPGVKFINFVFIWL